MAMPRSRFSRLDADERRRILETAAGEFASHGFAQASLNHVLEALGLSKGAFYYYFDSKADLFGAVIERAWEALLPDAVLDPASLDRETFWPELEAQMLALRRRVLGLPWLAGVARMLYHPMPEAEIDQLVAARFDRARDWLSAVLARGQELGAVRRDLPAGLLLAVLTAIDQASDHWLVDQEDQLDPVARDRLLREIFDLSRRIAEPSAPPADDPPADLRSEDRRREHVDLGGRRHERPDDV
jgi:AcrR family transcriptional regulator